MQNNIEIISGQIRANVHGQNGQNVFVCVNGEIVNFKVSFYGDLLSTLQAAEKYCDSIRTYCPLCYEYPTNEQGEIEFI